ncbi:unnamed protein product [Macrosiphum euphorbiae]|uniref:Uncharacterized protein n=1 Tax=Macrosiphum euphorbiae TaxID=13131 RepID=A0AAV0XCP8_9HEMI|nr:unnamed protein product [Macrosiphum euphorbiae]
MKNCVYVHLFNGVVRYLYLKHERKAPKWVWTCRVYEELFSRDRPTVRSLEICEMFDAFGLPADYRGYREQLVESGSLFAPAGHVVRAERLAILFGVSGFPPRPQTLAVQRSGFTRTIAFGKTFGMHI